MVTETADGVKCCLQNWVLINQIYFHIIGLAFPHAIVIIFKIMQVCYCTVTTLNRYIESRIISGDPFDGIGIDINIDTLCIRI